MEEMKEINKRLCKWCDDNMDIKLPRWEELPELEYLEYRICDSDGDYIASLVLE